MATMITNVTNGPQEWSGPHFILIIEDEKARDALEFRFRSSTGAWEWKPYGVAHLDKLKRALRYLKIVDCAEPREAVQRLINANVKPEDAVQVGESVATFERKLREFLHGS